MRLFRLAFLVLERHIGCVHDDDWGVGDRDAEGVAGEVSQHGLLAVARLGMASRRELPVTDM